MKKPWLAFVLSFLLPGLGLAYLGRWGLAAVNFLIAQGILLAVAVSESELNEYFHYVVLAVAAASAGWAHALAQRISSPLVSEPGEDRTGPA